MYYTMFHEYNYQYDQQYNKDYDNLAMRLECQRPDDFKDDISQYWMLEQWVK